MAGMGRIPGRKMISTLQASKFAVEGCTLRLDLNALRAKKERERVCFHSAGCGGRAWSGDVAAEIRDLSEYEAVVEVITALMGPSCLISVTHPAISRNQFAASGIKSVYEPLSMRSGGKAP